LGICEKIGLGDNTYKKMNKLLILKEVAILLRVSVSTVRRYVHNVGLPCHRIGGRLLFDEEEIEDWVKNHKIRNQIEAQIYKRNLQNRLTKFPLLDIDEVEGGQDAMAKAKKTKRLNCGFGFIYIRKTSKGKNRFYLEYYNSEGKRRQELDRVATNFSEAEISLKKCVEKERREKYGIDRRIGFQEYADIYIKNYAKRKKRSWKSDEKYLKSQLIPFFGNLELSEITPLHVQKFIEKRLEDGVQKNSINRHLQVLRKMMNWASEYGFEIGKNPVKPGHLFSETEFKRNRVLTHEEEEQLMSEAAPHLKDIIQYALGTGCRLQEILELRIEDIDFSSDVILIRAEINKTGKEDRIPINPSVKELLQRVVEENGGRSEFVFNYFDPIQKRLRPVKSIKVAFLNACRRSKLKNLQFRDLRRTFSSRLHENGVDPLIIQRLLRHSSFTISEQVYIQSNMRMMKEAVRILAEKQPKNRNSCYISVTQKKRGKRETFVTIPFSTN